MLKIEKKAIELIHRHLFFFMVASVFALSIWLRIGLWNYETGDYLSSFLPWYEAMQKYGFEIVMRQEISNYNVLFCAILYLQTKLPFTVLSNIKLAATVFDYGIALLLLVIVQQYYTGARKQLMSFAAFAAGCLLPIMAFNSAYWGQCESPYTFFLLLSLYAVMREKYPIGILLLGVALSLKLQAVFFLPLFVILYFVKKKFSILWFAAIPGVVFLSGLPAYLCGLPLDTVFTTYQKQTECFTRLTMNYPNWYTVFFSGHETLKTVGFVFAFSMLGGMLFWILYRRYPLHVRTLPLLSAWACMACVLCLPFMHERYAFYGEIALVLAVLLRPSKRLFLLTCAAHAIILVAYANYFYGTPGYINYWLTAANYGVFIGITQQLLRGMHSEISSQKEEPHGT